MTMNMTVLQRTFCSLVLALTLSTGACMKTAAVHPGAVNAFDSTVYDTLRSAQAALEQAKAQVGSNPAPAIRTAVNVALAAYNTAEKSYQTYHQLALSGANPDATGLQRDVAAVIANVAALAARIKGATK